MRVPRPIASSEQYLPPVPSQRAKTVAALRSPQARLIARFLLRMLTAERWQLVLRALEWRRLDGRVLRPPEEVTAVLSNPAEQVKNAVATLDLRGGALGCLGLH